MDVAFHFLVPFNDVFSFSNHSHGDNMEFQIPRESFGRNISLTWKGFISAGAFGQYNILKLKLPFFLDTIHGSILGSFGFFRQ